MYLEKIEEIFQTSSKSLLCLYAILFIEGGTAIVDNARGRVEFGDRSGRRRRSKR